jgi:general secretion pathway protein I
LIERAGSPLARGRRSGRQAGFTLIEVVVAFVLLALVFSTAFEIFSQGLSRAGALEERSRALEVASSQLADAGMEQPLADGTSSGEARDPRFRWTTSVTRYDEGSASDPDHPIVTPYQLYRIEVKVDWHGGDAKDHALTLATLKLGPRQ